MADTTSVPIPQSIKDTVEEMSNQLEINQSQISRQFAEIGIEAERNDAKPKAEGEIGLPRPFINVNRIISGSSRRSSTVSVDKSDGLDSEAQSTFLEKDTENRFSTYKGTQSEALSEAIILGYAVIIVDDVDAVGRFGLPRPLAVFTVDLSKLSDETRKDVLQFRNSILGMR